MDNEFSPKNEPEQTSSNPNNDMKEPESSALNSFIKNLRTNFLYGLFVMLPIFATIGLVIFLVNLISVPLSALTIQKIPPLVSFFLTIIILTFIGFAARNIIGRAILRFFEYWMTRIPIISIIYKS
ncbi:DUF502 domain-containing protein, partial [Thermoproteota archaeon]